MLPYAVMIVSSLSVADLIRNPAGRVTYQLPAAVTNIVTLSLIVFNTSTALPGIGGKNVTPRGEHFKQSGGVYRDSRHW